MAEKGLLVIVGPTASGKTSRAVAMAHALGGEIISADSRQVYRGMDLGTGKDLDEYGDIPYHLIDIAPAGYKYNLYEYLRDCNVAIDDVNARGRMPILCGGTGLYVESVLNGLALPRVPENIELRAALAGKSLAELTEMLSSMKPLHNTTDVDTCQRAVRAIEIACYYQAHPDEAVLALPHPRTDAVIIGVDISRDDRRRRISARLDARLQSGMVDEIRRLIDGGVSPQDLMYYGLEYKFVTRHVIGELSFSQMRDALEIAIHQFAKRQMTWFRGMERRGFTIHWLPYDMAASDFVSAVSALL